MKLNLVRSVVSGLFLSSVLAFFGASASAGQSQLDDLVKALRPVSAIHSNSAGTDYQTFPDEPRPGASPTAYRLHPTLEGVESNEYSKDIGLDQGLPLNIFSMVIGKNRREISLFLIEFANVDQVIQQQQVRYIYDQVLSSGETAEATFELKATGGHYARNVIDIYSLKARHLLSRSTLAKIDELHALPFRTIFSIFVEKDTGQIVCRVLIEGRNRKVSLIQKGETFEAALTAGVVRMYRDRHLFVAEDLARNDQNAFVFSYLNSVNSRQRGPLWPHVQGSGYAAQLVRTGKMQNHSAKLEMGLTLDDVLKTARYFPTVTAAEAALVPLPVTGEFDEPSDLEESESETLQSPITD